MLPRRVYESSVRACAGEIGGGGVVMKRDRHTHVTYIHMMSHTTLLSLLMMCPLVAAPGSVVPTQPARSDRHARVSWGQPSAAVTGNNGVLRRLSVVTVLQCCQLCAQNACLRTLLCLSECPACCRQSHGRPV